MEKERDIEHMLILSVSLYQAIDIMGKDNYKVLTRVLKQGRFVEAYISHTEDKENKIFVKLELDEKFIHLTDQISKDKFLNTIMKRLEEYIND